MHTLHICMNTMWPTAFSVAIMAQVRIAGKRARPSALRLDGAEPTLSDEEKRLIRFYFDEVNAGSESLQRLSCIDRWLAEWVSTVFIL